MKTMLIYSGSQLYFWYFLLPDLGPTAQFGGPSIQFGLNYRIRTPPPDSRPSARLNKASTREVYLLILNQHSIFLLLLLLVLSFNDKGS